MISITLMFETVEGAVAFLQNDAPNAGAAKVTGQIIDTPAKSTKGKGKKADKPAEAPAVRGESVAAEAEYEAVKAAALKLTHTKGRDKLVEVLASLGYKTAMDAKPGDYSNLVKALKYATDAEDEALV